MLNALIELDTGDVEDAGSGIEHVRLLQVIVYGTSSIWERSQDYILLKNHQEAFFLLHPPVAFAFSPAAQRLRFLLAPSRSFIL